MRPAPASRRTTRSDASTAVAAKKKAETVTGFIPLTYMDDSVAMAGGHMVRVEVPRSSLATFGIPVPDGAGGTVKADVVIGDDGVARAIRFVQ
jgi:hypothetical protein